MTTRHIADADLLQVIGCEIDKRPDAPGIDDLAPLITNVTRTPGELAVEFHPQAFETVSAFAAAERCCCPGLCWHVEQSPVVALRITSYELTLDALTLMFPVNRIDNAQ